MIYINKKTGEKVRAEQFSPQNIIAKYASVTVKSKEGAIVNMEAGDWVVQNGTRVYVVRKDTFNKLYKRVMPHQTLKYADADTMALGAEPVLMPAT
ncbi:hypothetical protein MKA58_09385 [[Clostridium] innocuum]|nr:hypothetical protein [[Clostridium] innocuum]